jgi:hypothetical protein
MSRGFQPVYEVTGAAEVREGEAISLAIRIEAPVDNEYVAEDLTGRVFKQRVLDGDTVLIEVTATIEPDEDGEDMAVFDITSDDTSDLLTGNRARDLRHVIVEIVGTDEFNVMAPMPFRVRA